MLRICFLIIVDMVAFVSGLLPNTERAPLYCAAWVVGQADYDTYMLHVYSRKRRIAPQQHSYHFNIARDVTEKSRDEICPNDRPHHSLGNLVGKRASFSFIRGTRST